MRKYSVEQSIDIANYVTKATSLIIGAVVAVAVGVILLKLLWIWTIPDLFPGAVEQGFISDDIAWLATLKLVVMVALLNSNGALIAAKWLR